MRPWNCCAEPCPLMLPCSNISNPDLPEIEGMSQELHQVLINLCLNACQAMPEGGVLTVQLQEGHQVPCDRLPHACQSLCGAQCCQTPAGV